MVYRGKPSAGCENCRKAKKRCGLELPACTRCVKLKKTCSGYRDTTALQIQDESETVKLKAERQKKKVESQQWQQQKSGKLDAAVTVTSIPTPASMNSDSSSSSDSTIDLDMTSDQLEQNGFLPSDSDDFYPAGWGVMPFVAAALKPKPDDIAMTYFYNQFTSNSHWDFMREFARKAKLDPCLDLAIKACGMAALDNVESVVLGRDYARSQYVEALSILNDALRDPKRCRTDEALIAVSMLGYYENLTCDGRASIQSWKAHVEGATQLLRLRGKAQFKTQVGRILFREVRNQIMISCIWDDRHPPDFLMDYQEELQQHTVDVTIAAPADALVHLCFDFASFRAKVRYREISDSDAAEVASELEKQFLQWSIDCAANDKWRYIEIEVADSEHVWDGKVHSYYGHPMPTVWNTWRSMRIMLSRTQEMLCRRFSFSDSEREEQMQYFRKIRRTLTDEICFTTPVALGHSSPAFTSACILITAYASIWPLFFAGTCALERSGPSAWEILMGQPPRPGAAHSAAAAQATWIMSRLSHISDKVGLKWADGVAAVLRGDFSIHPDVLPE